MSTYTRIFVNFLIRHVEMHIIIERLRGWDFVMFFNVHVCCLATMWELNELVPRGLKSGLTMPLVSYEGILAFWHVLSLY